MQITFFLIPKAETVFLLERYTMRQALEKMEYHGYTAVPVVDDEGKYLYTITVSDFLWKLKNTPGLSCNDTEKIALSEIPKYTDIQPVNIDSKLQDLLHRAMEQNFIPVVDDYNTYIGIVRRREIIEYCLPFIVPDEADTETLDIDVPDLEEYDEEY